MNVLRQASQALRYSYVAVDVDMSTTTASLVSQELKIIQQQKYTGSNKDIGARCVAAVEEILKSNQGSSDRPVAIGVSTQGNSRNGVVYIDRRDHLGTKVKEMLERRFGVRADVLNRFHALALGVCEVSGNSKEPNLGVINISNAVGYGVVRSGKVLEHYDSNNGAGGLQRIYRLSDGQGTTVKDTAGSKALKDASKRLFGQYSIDQLFSREKSDSKAAKVIEDAADAVAEMIVSLYKQYGTTTIYSLVYDKELSDVKDKQNFLSKVCQRISKKTSKNINVQLVDIRETDGKLIGATRRVIQGLEDEKNKGSSSSFSSSSSSSEIRSIVDSSSVKQFQSGNLFAITGLPASGKTTFISKTLMGELKSMGLKIGGIFCTEERSHGKRVGFSLNLLSPSKDTEMVELARMGECKGNQYEKFGIYSVNIKNIDEAAVASISAAKKEADVIVIDEVASMQLLSRRFRDMIRDILEVAKPIFITVPLNSKNHLVHEIKRLAEKNGQVFTLSAANREESQRKAIEKIRYLLRKNTSISSGKKRSLEQVSTQLSKTTCETSVSVKELEKAVSSSYDTDKRLSQKMGQIEESESIEEMRNKRARKGESKEDEESVDLGSPKS